MSERDEIIKKITQRAKKAFDVYEVEVRPHYRELIAILEPQAEKLGTGIRALIEVLSLLEEVKGVQDAAIGHAKEATISEEDFWNEFVQVTTLSMNIGEIINTHVVMRKILDDAPEDILEVALADLTPERKRFIRKVLDG